MRSQSESCSETNIAVHRKYGVLLQYYISYKHVVQTSTKSDDQVFFSGSSSSLHTYTCIYITKVIYLKPCKQRYLRSSIIDLIKPSLGVQSWYLSSLQIGQSFWTSRSCDVIAVFISDKNSLTSGFWTVFTKMRFKRYALIKIDCHHWNMLIFLSPFNT